VVACDSKTVPATHHRGFAPARQFLHSAHGNSPAFTLIELLAVVAIMAVIMLIAGAAFTSWGRNAGMRGSVLNLRSSLSLARQYAVTRRTRTVLVYSNIVGELGLPRGCYWIATLDRDGTPLEIVANTNYLAQGVWFTNDRPERIQFTFDGSGAGSGWVQMTGGIGKRIVLAEKGPTNSLICSTTVVYKLTGRVKTLKWGEG